MPEQNFSGGEPSANQTLPISHNATMPVTMYSKTYSAEEFQSMSTSQYLAGIAHVADKLGVELDSDNSPKKKILQIVDAVKSKITAAETAAKAIALEEANAKNVHMERELAALKLGIPADKVSRIVKYAEAELSDDVDFEKALGLVMQELSITKADSNLQDTKKPVVVTKTQTTEPAPAKRWKEMGAKERTEYFRKDRAAAIALAAVDGITLTDS